MDTTKMNYEINYISPSGTVREEYAEVKITMPIMARADAQKFLVELKQQCRLVEEIKANIELQKEFPHILLCKDHCCSRFHEHTLQFFLEKILEDCKK